MVKVNNLGEWRAVVASRAGYKCERCGKKARGRDGQAHHKLPRWFMPGLTLDVDNGIYLCTQCHKSVHGGRGSVKDEEYTMKILKEAIRQYNSQN